MKSYYKSRFHIYFMKFIFFISHLLASEKKVKMIFPLLESFLNHCKIIYLFKIYISLNSIQDLRKHFKLNTINSGHKHLKSD
jgi:hypothetical protein